MLINTAIALTVPLCKRTQQHIYVIKNENEKTLTINLANLFICLMRKCNCKANCNEFLFITFHFFYSFALAHNLSSSIINEAAAKSN